MTTRINLSFWSTVASAWDRTISDSLRTAIKHRVREDVDQSMADLHRHKTFEKIPSALEAILMDEDEEDIL